ncbi:MAG: hypothetical protein LUQ60_07000, partial [Methanomicrobiales archaeon]|nr:hypothetical protein [Methanomicrobiales archaeon]
IKVRDIQEFLVQKDKTNKFTLKVRCNNEIIDVQKDISEETITIIMYDVMKYSSTDLNKPEIVEISADKVEIKPFD